MPEERQSNDMPAVAPGEIWLIEQDTATMLSPFDRGVVTSANVVLYDRALEPLVARVLPLGAYAEPLSGTASAAGSAISPRAIQFARDGWSVVQLVEACGRRARLQDAVVALAPRRAGDLPVQVIVKRGAGPFGKRNACLPTLADLVAEVDDDDPLTLVFGPLAVRSPAQRQAFTANGLAG